MRSNLSKLARSLDYSNRCINTLLVTLEKKTIKKEYRSFEIVLIERERSIQSAYVSFTDFANHPVLAAVRNDDQLLSTTQARARQKEADAYREASTREKNDLHDID